MVNAPLVVEEKRKALAAAYPEWRVWLSSRGELWNATRVHDLAGRDRERLDRTLVCDSAAELAAALAGQRALEQRTAPS